jgi:hypothetical protein
MKRPAAFLKATTLGGLFVVLPLIVVFGLMAKVAMGVHEVAEPVMAKITGEHSDAAHFSKLLPRRRLRSMRVAGPSRNLTLLALPEIRPLNWRNNFRTRSRV